MRNHGLVTMAAQGIPAVTQIVFAVMSYVADSINDIIDQSANSDIATHCRMNTKCKIFCRSNPANQRCVKSAIL